MLSIPQESEGEPGRRLVDAATAFGVIVTSSAATILALLTVVSEEWRIGLAILLGLLLFLNVLVVSGWVSKLVKRGRAAEVARRIRAHPEFITELCALAEEAQLAFSETNRTDCVHHAAERVIDEARRLSQQGEPSQARDIGEIEGKLDGLRTLTPWWSPIGDEIESLPGKTDSIDTHAFVMACGHLGSYVREGTELANRFLQRCRQCAWFKPTEYAKDEWSEFVAKANDVVERFGDFTKRAQITLEVNLGFWSPKVRELR